MFDTTNFLTNHHVDKDNAICLFARGKNKIGGGKRREHISSLYAAGCRYWGTYLI